jgi:hypothetical protein
MFLLWDLDSIIVVYFCPYHVMGEAWVVFCWFVVAS